LLNFHNSVLDHTESAFTGSTVYFHAHGSLLADLGNDRARLESEVEGSASQAAQLRTIFSGPNLEFYSSHFDLEHLFPCSANAELAEAIEQFDEADNTLWVCSHHNVPGGQNVLSPSPTPPLAIVGGMCPRCYYRGALVEHKVGGCGPVFVSTWCPVCGWCDADDVFAQFTTSIIAKIAPFENLSHPEILLRLVMAAVAILLYFLKGAILRHEIAISQRSFFTHHGAHPPRVQPQPVSGLLLGRVFQPRFAA
jgi:hypothetical protein